MTRAFKQRFPAGWRATSLGDELPLAYGKGLPAKSRDATGTFPVYGSAGVAGHHSESLVDGPALIVGRKGNVGMAHLVAGPSWPIDTTYFATFRSDQAPKFFKYLLDYLDLRSLDKSTAIPSLSRDDYNAVPISVPDATEQHRIVAAIETHFSRLDAAVASLTRAKANVKRARASVLKAAVEGRLVPTEAALARAEGRDYEPAAVLLDRILAERKAAWAASGARGKYKEPVKPETEGLLGLPEGWCWATVDAVCANIVDCPHSTPKRVQSGKLCARTTQFKPGFLDLSNPEFVTEATYRERISRLKPEPGDILYSREGGILGIACPVPNGVELCLGQRMMLMRASASSHPRYLMLVLNSPLTLSVVRRLTGGSAAPHINVGDIKAFGVPLPPLPEQHRIVAEVDRRLSVLDALDATLDANLARCDRLRQAVLKRAFEGRLVPAEADAPLLAAEPQMPLFAQDARS